MRRMKPLILLSMILIPSYILITTPPVKADEGYAKVYIVCLSDVTCWNFGDQESHESKIKVKEGAIRAIEFKEDDSLPMVHPKLGKTPPFYGISYQVVTDWNTYKTVIESYKEVIIVNTHGEILPIPSGYDPMGWTNKIAEAMLKRRVTWVHTGGYPFYRVWHQGATQSEEWPSDGTYGFKNFTHRINLNDVTCHPPGSETERIRINEDAEYTLEHGWSEITNAFRVEHGRPLKASDFKNYTILCIWGTEDAYMTGAVIAFVKPSERALPEERYGFGAYVHIGTRKTFTSGHDETDGDYYRGYVGAAVAIWTEVEAFEPTTVTKEYVEQDSYTSWGFSVTPVITYYSSESGTYKISIDFGICGCMKTNEWETIGDVEFYLECPSGCQVVMRSNASKNAYKYDKPTLGIDWVKVAKVGVSTVLFFVSPEPGSKLYFITKGIGGVMLFSNWLGLLPTQIESVQGVDEMEPPNHEVDFKYDPSEYYTEPGDGYRYGEFESIIHIELEVNMADREQWTIVPLDWYVGLRDAGGSYVASTWSRTSIALFKAYETSNYKATVFFDDFKDLDGWSVGDTDSLAGYDYWGAWSWATALHCAGVGTNSLYGEKTNLEAGGPLSPIYDKGMNAYLTKSVDLRPYRNAWLRYSLGYVISSGDYLAVEYYCNGVWNNLNTHSGVGPGSSPVEVSLPVNAQKIRFRFYSNGDDDVSWGVRLDYVEMKAGLPNDANSMSDAGEGFGEATAIQISESLNNYAGYLNYDEDWYQFEITSTYVSNHRKIYVWLNEPSNAVFNLTLYDKDGNKKAGPVSSGQALTYILSSTDLDGMWRIKIHPIQGFGQYDFDIQLKPPYVLTVKTCKTTGQGISNVKVWIDSTQYYSPVTLEVDEGTASVQVQSNFRRVALEFTFDHWEDGSTSNPRSVPINNDKVIKAYYEVEYLGTCPTLFVWNGSEYVLETLLDIHAESDVTLQHQIEQPLVKDGWFYKLSLRELDNFTSHIDYVKLYVVDSECEMHLCPPVKAVHNELGRVTALLWFDDERKVDLAPTETIDLKFTYFGEDIAYFVFEINGHNRKIP